MTKKTTLVFQGWVPTLSGRLSFLKIGDTVHPNPCRKYSGFNPKNNLGRVYCSQIRYTGDSELPLIIIKSLFTWIGHLSYLTSPDSSHLKNRALLKSIARPISIFLESINPIIEENFSFHLSGEWTSDTLNGIIGVEYRNSPHKIEALKPTRNRAEEEWKSMLNEESIPITGGSAHQAYSNQIRKSLYYCDFSLERNGVLKLELPISAAPDELSDLANMRPYISLAGEMYYFLKEITHTHKHHESSSDRVIDIYCTNEKAPISWMDRISANLLRHIVEKQRMHPLNTNMHRAIGMLAYCESFERIRKMKGCQTQPAIHFDLLKQSISSKISEHQEQKNNYESRRTILIACTGLAIAAAALASSDYARQSLPITYDCYLATGFANIEIIIYGALAVAAWQLSDTVKSISRKAYKLAGRKIYNIFAVVPKMLLGYIIMILSMMIFLAAVDLTTNNTKSNTKFQVGSALSGLRKLSDTYSTCKLLRSTGVESIYKSK